MRRASVGSIALLATAAWAPAAVGATEGGATTGVRAAVASGATGRAARRVNLVEVGRLTLLNEEGSTVYEHGSARGTYSGSVTATFVIHAKSVVVSVTLHARGGTISGVAHANYEVVKKRGYFGGTLTFGHSTGAYSQIAAIGGHGPGFSGVIDRDTLETEVKVNGTVSL